MGFAIKSSPSLYSEFESSHSSELKSILFWMHPVKEETEEYGLLFCRRDMKR